MWERGWRDWKKCGSSGREGSEEGKKRGREGRLGCNRVVKLDGTYFLSAGIVIVMVGWLMVAPLFPL